MHVGVNRIEIFGTSASKTLLHWTLQDNVLSGPEDLGGILTSAPAAVVWTSTIVNATVVTAIVRNTNNSMSYRSFYNGRWTPWQDLGGVNFSSGPAAISDGPNDVEVVAKGSNNQIYVKLLTDSKWGNWFSLGSETFSSAPAIGSIGKGYWEVFARGNNNALYHKRHLNGDDPGDWSIWFNAGGVLGSAPAVATYGFGKSGAMAAFASTPTQTIEHYTVAYGYNGPWANESDPLTPDLATTSWASGEVDLFTRSANGVLVHRTYAGNYGAPLLPTGAWTALLHTFSSTNYGVAGW